jgi:hypothetical protein
MSRGFIPVLVFAIIVLSSAAMAEVVSEPSVTVPSSFPAVLNATPYTLPFTTEIPTSGATMVISGNMKDGQLESGTAVLVLYPIESPVNATIRNTAPIDPAQVGRLPVLQNITATPLASYEIDAIAPRALFCYRYQGKLGKLPEQSVDMYRFNGTWTPLSADRTAVDMSRGIICGRISNTAYMVAGFAIAGLPSRNLLALPLTPATIYLLAGAVIAIIVIVWVYYSFRKEEIAEIVTISQLSARVGKKIQMTGQMEFVSDREGRQLYSFTDHTGEAIVATSIFVMAGRYTITGIMLGYHEGIPIVRADTVEPLKP